MEILRSEIDDSVNFIWNHPKGAFEARYVRRDDYAIFYISSHTGCNQGCRFCHLTATGQIKMAPANFETFEKQIEVLSAYHASQPPTKCIHINFMARGEPLLNPLLTAQWTTFHELIGVPLATQFRASVIYNISTIMPRGYRHSLAKDFAEYSPRIYYSLYSLDPEWRARWLPNAQPPEEALAKLARFQRATGSEVVIHHALIHDENDTVEQAWAIHDAVRNAGIKTRLNLVRYNPFSPEFGLESNNYEGYKEAMGLSDSDKIVSRVGPDVYASCGMFVHDYVSE